MMMTQLIQILRPRLTLTSTSAHFLPSRALRLLAALVQSRGKRIPADEEDHGGALSGPPLAVEQTQPLALDLMLTEFLDAVIDQRGRSFFMLNRHLEFIGVYPR